MFEKLKSRKLLVFVFTVLVIIANYVFALAMPVESLMSLVIASASYILAQAYVDGKTQPVGDIATAITDIVHSQIIKTPVGKTLPLDELTIMFEKILEDRLSKLNVLTLVTPAPVVSDPVDPAATIYIKKAAFAFAGRLFCVIDLNIFFIQSSWNGNKHRL